MKNFNNLIFIEKDQEHKEYIKHIMQYINYGERFYFITAANTNKPYAYAYRCAKICVYRDLLSMTMFDKNAPSDYKIYTYYKTDCAAQLEHVEVF